MTDYNQSDSVRVEEEDFKALHGFSVERRRNLWLGLSPAESSWTAVCWWTSSVCSSLRSCRRCRSCCVSAWSCRTCLQVNMNIRYVCKSVIRLKESRGVSTQTYNSLLHQLSSQKHHNNSGFGSVTHWWSVCWPGCVAWRWGRRSHVQVGSCVWTGTQCCLTSAEENLRLL